MSHRERTNSIGYRNAADVLPEALIHEIRRYVEGEAIYIPKADQRSRWGENNGRKNEYEDRNRRIAEERRKGATAAELSERYFLSEDSIRKILKKQKG